MSYFEIDKFLEIKLKNRIDRVGVELEGGWETLPKFEFGEKLERDGSVSIDPIPLDSAPSQINPFPNESFDLAQALRVYNSNHPQHRQLFLLDGIVRDDPSRQRFVDYRGRPIGMESGQAFLANLRAGNDPLTGSPNRYKKIYIGEVAGPPLEVNKIAEWMRKCYPQHVNNTCGLHVHVSFRKALHYSRLMVPEYQDTIIAYLTKWAMEEKIDKSHPIWGRLTGKNEFCKHEFFADYQARKTSKAYDHHGPGNRYTAINYSHGQHGTIECRVLPMFSDVEVAVKAVNKVVDITNACLKVGAKKEETLSASVVEDSVNSMIRENRREYI